MGSFPTRPFKESKPQNGEPVESLLSSVKISTPTGCRRPAFTTPQLTGKKVDKDMLWIYWKPKRRISWLNNEKFQREGKNNFFK